MSLTFQKRFKARSTLINDFAFLHIFRGCMFITYGLVIRKELGKEPILENIGSFCRLPEARLASLQQFLKSKNKILLHFQLLLWCKLKIDLILSIVNINYVLRHFSYSVFFLHLQVDFSLLWELPLVYCARKGILNKLWSSQLWTQFMQLRISKPKKFKTSAGFETVTGSKLVEVLNFSGFYIRNYINCVHNCEDHSLLDFTSAVQYMKYFV